MAQRGRDHLRQSFTLTTLKTAFWKPTFPLAVLMKIDPGLRPRDAGIFGFSEHCEIGDRALAVVDRRADGLRPVDQVRGGSNHDCGMARRKADLGPEIDVEGSIIEDNSDPGALVERGEGSSADRQIGGGARARLTPWGRR